MPMRRNGWVAVAPFLRLFGSAGFGLTGPISFLDNRW